MVESFIYLILLALLLLLVPCLCVLHLFRIRYPCEIDLNIKNEETTWRRNIYILCKRVLCAPTSSIH